MVCEKFKILVGKVKKRLSDIKAEDLAKFAIKEAAGSIPIVGQYITDAIEEFSPDEKFELLQELKLISEKQYTEIRMEFGMQETGHEEIKGLLNCIKEILSKEVKKPPNIQYVLNKGRTTKGGFFKTRPEWVDFEQDFIVERNEVKEIITNLRNKKIQFVLGSPAAGKSIILKNVGFQLAKYDNKKVYIVELKRHSIDKIKLFFENIPKIDNENPIFIVDDAHLYLSDCERLAEEFNIKGKGNLIIGSRETREITEDHPREGPKYELLNELSKTCIHIRANEDVTEKMIRTFLKEYHFDEDKIKIISSNLIEFKKDLWLLSCALKAYDLKKKSMNIDEIYDKIYENITYSIQNIKVGIDEYLNAEDVFLPLSIFYRYEIPVERYFLEDKDEMDIDRNIIDQLIRLQEIVETHKMLSLHHSSIAKLYFGAYLKKYNLGKRIKKNILNERDEKDLEFCLFYRYITTNPENAVDVVINLRRDQGGKKIGFNLLQKLAVDDEIQKSIEKGIEKEEDIGKIGKCLLDFAADNKEAGLRLANSIDIHVLSSKIDKEVDIEKIGMCLSDCARMGMSIEIGSKVADSIDIDAPSWKINKFEFGSKVADSIDIDALSSKINKVVDIGKIAWCVDGIAEANREVGLKLVDGIDIQVLSSKINTEAYIEKIGKCVSFIARVNKNVALKLVDGIDIDALSSKIEKEEDLFEIGVVVGDIIEVNPEAGLKLVDSVSSRINKEEDIEKIGVGVGTLAARSPKAGLKLVDSVSRRINEEKDIAKVGICMEDIALRSKEMGLKLADSIDIHALSSKIDKEADIEKIGFCIGGIGEASKEVTTEIVSHLNPTLRETILARFPQIQDLFEENS